MSSPTFDFALAIGDAAGQGIATPGDVLARIFFRRGLHLVSYNAYQSIIRGGHIFLTVRVSNQTIHNHGDKLDVLLCLNQDTMDRHLRIMEPGSRAGMMEVPVDFINVQRAGPSTGVPTKTEQGDRWQALGASQGDYERFIVAPKSALDAFNTIPEVFNLCDRAQCPAIVISDLYISEGRFSDDPDEIDLYPKFDRGELITTPRSDVSDLPTGPQLRRGYEPRLIGAPSNRYLRYENTESGISPRALPGLKGYVHVVSTDEHDEDGALISDEFTNPHERRRMVEKRARKFQTVANDIAAPELEGPANAEVTLVGWGSMYGVLTEAVELLRTEGIIANHLHVKWIVPFHGDSVAETLSGANRIIIVENNHSGQFARYLRSETGIVVDGHIRKYDGDPFQPHHVVNGVVKQLANGSKQYVPQHEIMV